MNKQSEIVFSAFWAENRKREKEKKKGATEETGEETKREEERHPTEGSHRSEAQDCHGD